jgi:hypothetical protein
MSCQSDARASSEKKQQMFNILRRLYRGASWAAVVVQLSLTRVGCPLARGEIPVLADSAPGTESAAVEVSLSNHCRAGAYRDVMT